MPIVCYIFSALFLYFGIYRLPVDPADAGISLMIALACLIYGLLFHRDERQKEGLKVWIYRNCDELRKNGLMYNGVRIDEQTQFVQYHYCFSYILFTHQKYSGYYIKEHHATGLLRILFSGFSLVFGWWGMPWGPLRTIECIRHNTLSKSLSLSEVINQMREEDMVMMLNSRSTRR